MFFIIPSPKFKLKKQVNKGMVQRGQASLQYFGCFFQPFQRRVVEEILNPVPMRVLKTKGLEFHRSIIAKSRTYVNGLT